MSKKTIRKKITAMVFTFMLVFTTVNFLTGCANGEAIAEKIASKNTAKYESLFEKDKVVDIYVEVGEEDWKSMLSDPLAEEYKSAKVTVDGTVLENVGFRTKGNLTLREVSKSDSDRYSFRIKLDKYVKGQNLLGLDEFVVNNMYSDPSYMREYLSYEALREMGEDVPLTTFANIYINGKLYGFYLMVEAVEDSFLERNFNNDSGNLYKQEQGSTLEYVENSNYDKSELKSGKDETKADLKNLIKTLNEMPEGEKGNIESVLDVDSALKYIAANTVLGNYDSYSGNLAQNYYLYGQEDKFTVIPWDYNMSMAGFGGRESTTIPIDEPVMSVNIKNLPLINNLLAVKEYKEKYHEYVKEFLYYLENFEDRVTEVANVIRPYVKADPTKFYTMEEFESNIIYSKTNNEDTEKDMLKESSNQDRPEPPQDMAKDFSNGERQKPPQGEMDANKNGGPNGGMGMMKNSTSIVTFIKDRVENIKKQLAGELPTTGNTTMDNNRMRGNRENKQ